MQLGDAGDEVPFCWRDLRGALGQLSALREGVWYRLVRVGGQVEEHCVGFASTGMDVQGLAVEPFDFRLAR